MVIYDEIKQVKISNIFCGTYLPCGACGGDFTHIASVEVFMRKEDADSGMHVLIEQASVGVDANLSRNPSPRRDGIKIMLSCETCNETAPVNIVQHKGNNFIYYAEE